MIGLFNKQYIEYNNTYGYDEYDYEYNKYNNDEHSIINNIPQWLKTIINEFVN